MMHELDGAGKITATVGIGMTMPLYITVVMSALPQQYLGVVSSQTMFWRNIGSTVGVNAERSPLATADTKAVMTKRSRGGVAFLKWAHKKGVRSPEETSLRQEPRL